MATRVLIAQLDEVIAAGAAAILRDRNEFEVRVLEGKSRERLRGLWPHADVVVAGYEAAVALAQDSAGAARIMVLTSAHAEPQVRVALELGLQGYLMIGCKASELIDAVRAVASGQRALSALATSRLAESLSSPRLTTRELAVLRVLALGMGNKAIARHFSLSVGTVKTHVKSINSKLRARSRTEAAASALRRGLVRLPDDEENFPPNPMPGGSRTPTVLQYASSP